MYRPRWPASILRMRRSLSGREMEEWVIDRESLFKLLERAREQYLLIAPREDSAGLLQFAAVEGVEEIALPYSQTVKSPKEWLFPQREEVLRFSLNVKTVSLSPGAEVRPLLLFGLHPCDLRGLAILDMVFAQGEYLDAAYIARREAALVIGLACSTADVRSTCFCTSVGVSPVEGDGSDLFLTDLGDGSFLVEGRTEKGIEVFRHFSPSLQAAPEEARERREVEAEAMIERLPPQFDIQALTERLGKRFTSPCWEQVSQTCLSCGACAYVCPVCHCFFISDEMLGNSGVRVKGWDACTFVEYSRMGGGYNPRPTNTERFRQRIFHKFVYFPANEGSVMCTGCGRCIDNCPAGIDLVQVLREELR